MYPEFNKKLINVKNWLDGYNIRQKKESTMTAKDIQKIKDIDGRMTTVIALVEMIGKDMMDEFGKDPLIKESYQALFRCREEILKSKENFPQDV